MDWGQEMGEAVGLQCRDDWGLLGVNTGGRGCHSAGVWLETAMGRVPQPWQAA